MKLAWLTDIHLNFLDLEARLSFYQQILDTKSDGVMISGDIAEADSIVELLEEMAEYLKKPIYFILGNHDYYQGSIAEVRLAMTELCKANPLLHWLPASGVMQFSDKSLLVGQDLWADARLGDYEQSQVQMSDSLLIAELVEEQEKGRENLRIKMQQLADADVKALQKQITTALEEKPDQLTILMHIPPFREVCFYRGQISDDNWLPFFCSKSAGDMLMDIAKKNPAVQFKVFCGHTHNAALFNPLANLAIEAGGAKYSLPVIQKIIETNRVSKELETAQSL